MLYFGLLISMFCLVVYTLSYTFNGPEWIIILSCVCFGVGMNMIYFAIDNQKEKIKDMEKRIEELERFVRFFKKDNNK